MRSTTAHRKLAALAAALTLALALAGPPPAHAARRGAPGLRVPALTEILSGFLGRLSALWGKTGSAIDPNNKPGAVPPGDAGGAIDPDNGPAAAGTGGGTSDAGSAIDPDN